MDPYVRDIADALSAAAPIPPRPSRPSRGPIPCPVCQAEMSVERTHGVEVDVCPRHGVWFDLGEVSQLIDRVLAADRVGLAGQFADEHEGFLSSALFRAWMLLQERRRAREVTPD